MRKSRYDHRTHLHCLPSPQETNQTESENSMQLRWSSLRPRNCHKCGSVNHTSLLCPWVKRKPLSPKGKQFKKWRQARDEWLKENKAPYYFCYICGKSMTRSQLTLDHIKARSRSPELRYSLDNLQPCCAACNHDKGSLSLEQYLKKRDAYGTDRGRKVKDCHNE